MIKKIESFSNTNIVFVDLFFILLIFFQPLISVIVFEASPINTNIFFVLIIACWAIVKIFFSNFIIKNVLWFDVVVIILITASLFHFILYSQASVYYFKLWVYIAYLIIFYLFRSCLVEKGKSKYLIYGSLFLIITTSLFQSLVAILQYFEVIKVKNKYFKLLGSFTSPNLLGAYLGLSFIILIWYFFIRKSNKKIVWILGVLSCFIFLYLIVLSNSRGAWLAIITSIGIFIITSKKIKTLLDKIPIYKKLIFGLCIIIFSVFCFKYLYHLKPESVKGRLLITKISLQEIAKKPIIGSGLYSFAGKYNKAKATYFASKKRSWEEIKVGTYVFTAFNDYILIAFELGVIILFLIICLIFFTVLTTKINKQTRLGLSLFIYGCVFAFFNSLINSILLMSIGLFGLTLILKYGEFKKTKILLNNYINNIFIKLSILLLATTGIYFAFFKLANQNEFYRFTIKENSLKEFFYKSHAIEDNIFSKFIIGQKLYNAGYIDQGKEYMEYAFKNSSAPRIGKELANIYIQEKKFKKAEDVFKFNINVEPYRYEARMDLLELFESTKQENKALEVAQEIIKLPVKVPSSEVIKFKNKASKIVKSFN